MIAPPTNRIAELLLRSPDPDASRQAISSTLPLVGDSPEWPHVASVRFSAGTDASAEPRGALSNFWKFSVFTDDIQHVSGSLSAAGVAVSEPVQFGEIGYLCHLQEPGGNAIELIQRTFQQHPPVAIASPDILGLITLRVSDPVESMRFYVEGLGMGLMCTMAVDDGRADPFDLYFLGYVDEQPPDPDPASVRNREWLYQRKATCIELQHYRPPTPALYRSGHAAPGLDHIKIATNDLARVADQLSDMGVQVDLTPQGASFESPDGHQFRCVPGLNW